AVHSRCASERGPTSSHLVAAVLHAVNKKPIKRIVINVLFAILAVMLFVSLVAQRLFHPRQSSPGNMSSALATSFPLFLHSVFIFCPFVQLNRSPQRPKILLSIAPDFSVGLNSAPDTESRLAHAPLATHFISHHSWQLLRSLQPRSFSLLPPNSSLLCHSFSRKSFACHS